MQYLKNEGIQYKLKVLDQNGQDMETSGLEPSQQQRAKQLKDRMQKKNEQFQIAAKQIIADVHNPIKEEEEDKDCSDDDDIGDLLISEANIDFSQDALQNDDHSFDDCDYNIGKNKKYTKPSRNSVKKSFEKERPKNKEKLKRTSSKNVPEVDD